MAQHPSRRPASITLTGIVLATGLVAACSRPPDLHLVAQGAGESADIRIDGMAGIANWAWGSKTRSEHVTVVGSKKPASGHGATGPLLLRMASGTTIELVERHGFYICEKGCEKAGMPVTWAPATSD